ncbi:MAG TPA: TonB-dependent receptor [Candidatus Latescibacteria bacterium]|nr:TonB-dependent receptor [Candidatus Latescibacterota bacterium]
MRSLVFCFLASWCAAPLIAHAATLSGVVIDAETGAPVTAAVIHLDNTPHGTLTDQNGAFTLNGLPAGRHIVTVGLIGYRLHKQRVTLGDEPVSLSIALHPEVLPGQTVLVTASRVKDREAPVTFTNLPREEIARTYSVQDVPVLLQSLPSVHAYSDAGNGVGYSYLSVRGFGQKRVNVLINGIPQNGPTSHEVYWVDLPDVLSNVQDIQVQRGVGSSLYGSSAIGGSINVITTNFNPERSVTAFAGAGSYGTRKLSVAFNSGLVDDSYAMYGRFSRITSDGYRQQSWSDLWSYFLGVRRFDPSMTTTLLVYGGPERTHLAYNGVTRAYLDGTVSGDARADRRYNPLTYENEIDTFNQPHYELHHDWQIAPALRLNTTLYAITGEGYYDQFRKARSLEEFRLPTFRVKDPSLYPLSWYTRNADGTPRADANGDYTITKSDLTRRRNVENREYGVLPRMAWEHHGGTLTAGGELRAHSGRHWGQITWLAAPPPGVAPGHLYYDYRERKLTTSAFVQEMAHILPRVTLMADLQAVRHLYTLDRDSLTRYRYDAEFRWISPKAGVNVNITDRLHAFTNIAYARREPITDDLADPQDYWNEPSFAERETTFVGGQIGQIRLKNPTVKPERVINFELGTGYRSPRINAMLTLYHMDFRNEIVPWVGQISEASGNPVTGNADRSVHRGIELEATATPAHFLELGGNVSINNDHFVRYTEHQMDWDAWQTVSLPRNGNRIAGFPTMLANARARLTHGGWSLGATWRYAGRQYLDNAENTANSIAPYHVTDVSLAYRIEKRFGLKGMEVRVSVNNLFDRLYEASGYVDDVYAVASQNAIYATPYFIPAAPRNAFFSIQWEL